MKNIIKTLYFKEFIKIRKARKLPLKMLCGKMLKITNLNIVDFNFVIEEVIIFIKHYKTKQSLFKRIVATINGDWL